jgi:hypothetical protein
MNKVIFENKQEIVVFVEDGRLLHTHKTDLSQHHSLDTWPDFESARKAFESGHVRWGNIEK